MEKRKIFDIKLNDQEGIVAVSLVDQPAIEENFMAFEKVEEPLKFVETSNFKQVVTGPLLIPDKLILRVDPNSKEAFYVKFSQEVIEQLALKFMKNKFIDQTNEDHDQSKTSNQNFLFESVIIKNDEMALAFEKIGLNKLPVGSWVGSFKIESKETFQRVLSGELRGFSVEAFLDTELSLQAENKEFSEKREKLTKYFKNLK